MKKTVFILILLLLAGSVYASDPDFDCKTLGITLDKCYSQDGIFKAEFMVKGAKAPASYDKVINIIKGVDYTLDTNKQYKTINGDIVARGTLPYNYKLNNIVGDRYSLEADMGDNIVKSLRIAYTKDDLYEYTFEIDYCYLKASNLKIDVYGFKMCDVLSSAKPVEENKITGKVVEPVIEKQDEKSNAVWYALGGVLVLGLIILGVILKKRNKSKIGVK